MAKKKTKQLCTFFRDRARAEDFIALIDPATANVERRYVPGRNSRRGRFIWVVCRPPFHGKKR